jgi:hypothetical protein
MSVMESDIQWFIARDSKQHGPLTDIEMRKLVELGHLRPTDLIWRQGFPDWRPAAAVFPSTVAGAPSAASAAKRAAPQPAAVTAARAPRHEPATLQPTIGQRGSSASAAVASEDRQAMRPEAVPNERASETGGNRRAFIVAFLLLLLTGGGAWLGYKYRDTVRDFVSPGEKKLVSADVGKTAPETEAAKPVETAVTAPPVESTNATEDRLKKSPLWIQMKQDFPDWYQERVKEATRLAGENKPDIEIMQYLVQELVALRRQNADKALAASTEKHKQLASAFLANLKKLAEEGAETCYSFISKGETSPPVVALMQDPQKSGPIEAQVLAIFAAIAEGRQSPTPHSAPIKGDYDVLIAELNRLGWTQADIQMFADPKAFAKAPHDRVCQMVQDWFAAQLAIQDAATQERLLLDAVRPLVAGG